MNIKTTFSDDDFSGIIHQDSDTRIPSSRGWLYLSRDRVWMEDPGIKVTGIRNTQEDGVRTACPPETDTDYPGHDLQSLTSADLATCVRMCRTRGTCRGVTWTRDTCQMKFRTVLSRIFKLLLRWNIGIYLHYWLKHYSEILYLVISNELNIFGKYSVFDAKANIIIQLNIPIRDNTG